jgi:8-oxo-dGTP pyrophosphatase MutT (NUDIX family)
VLVRVVEENGKQIVEHPGSVAIVAIDKQDRVVLVEQYRRPARKKLLELPAGVREEGEPPLETARRELKEECGLHGGEWHELAAAWTTPGFVREHMTLFVATGLDEGEADPDDGEDVRIVRRPASEIPQLLGDIEDMKTLAGLLLYQARQESNAT